PQSGIQVLPVNGQGKKTTYPRRVAMEADDGRSGKRNVARLRGELKCDGGRSRREMQTSIAKYNRTSNSKKKSNAKAAHPRKKLTTRPCVLSAIPLLLPSKPALFGVGTPSIPSFAI